MPNKPYKAAKNKQNIVSEPAVAYRKTNAKTFTSSEWNPNVPFHGTQEEWWEHFHRIEEGSFYPVSEVHQRISQWLDNQKK
jgi:hypothetical protein